MSQRQEQRLVVRLALDAARWGWSRNIEPVEGLSLAIGVGWFGSLVAGGVFGSASSYRAMARLSALTRPVADWGWRPEWPWAIAIGAIVLHLLLAYGLGAWGYLRAGYWDGDDWRVHWSRRIRFGGLFMLSGWWMWIAVMFGIANWEGVGWKIYIPLSLWTSWSSVRLVWDYGAAVVPLLRARVRG